MQETGVRNSSFGADKFGLTNLKSLNWNFEAPQLYEHSLRAGEAVLSADVSLHELSAGNAVFIPQGGAHQLYDSASSP